MVKNLNWLVLESDELVRGQISELVKKRFEAKKITCVNDFSSTMFTSKNELVNVFVLNLNNLGDNWAKKVDTILGNNPKGRYLFISSNITQDFIEEVVRLKIENLLLVPFSDEELFYKVKLTLKKN